MFGLANCISLLIYLLLI